MAVAPYPEGLWGGRVPPYPERTLSILESAHPQGMPDEDYLPVMRVLVEGMSLHAGRDLRPGQFPTAERRGRLHTDLARAWWQLGRPEQTAVELAAAHREAPGEVRDRPSIRRIVADLTRRHPNAVGVRDLRAATGAR